MKYLFSFLLLICVTTTYGQISFPKGFKLIKGDNLMGEDDRYSNGKDVFQTHLFWRSYDNYTWNDDNVKLDISKGYGFPMYRTTDSLLWGTGKTDELYFYVVVDWNGEIFELFSRENDADFAGYSKWLITSMREYRKKGKTFLFPRRIMK
ncbi:hypothetical protein [Chitinophaga dinghuensis]|nr:hypothetical protein [Chitinophaga dinghuensis]